MVADTPSIHVTAPLISLHESKLGSNRLGDFVKLSGRVSHEHGTRGMLDSPDISDGLG
jgi:hypothetical protein